MPKFSKGRNDFLHLAAIGSSIIILAIFVVFTQKKTNLTSKAKEYRSFKHALLLENQVANVPYPETFSYIGYDGNYFSPKLNFTAEVWFKPMYPEFPSKYIFSYKESNPNLALLVSSYKNSKGTYDMNFQAYIGDGDNSCNPKYVIYNSKDLTSEEVLHWRHAALVVDEQGVVKLFVNGDVSLDSNQIGSKCITDSEFLLSAGGSEPGAFFPGEIDEFRISSIARYSESFLPPVYPFAPDNDTLVLIKLDKDLEDIINPSLIGVAYGPYSFVNSTIAK